jgi:hypothetical protein
VTVAWRGSLYRAPKNSVFPFRPTSALPAFLPFLPFLAFLAFLAFPSFLALPSFLP